VAAKTPLFGTHYPAHRAKRRGHPIGALEEMLSADIQFVLLAAVPRLMNAPISI